MAITYPVDVENTLWAVYNTETFEIVGRNKKWPREDGGPIEGQDPNFIHLLQNVSERPQYDSRLYTLDGTEVVDVPNNALITTWNTVKRPKEERKAAAKNEEAKRFTSIVDLAREAVSTRLMVGAIIRYIVNAEDFPPKVQTMSDEYVGDAIMLWRNRDRLDEILAEIELDEADPDLDLFPEGSSE